MVGSFAKLRIVHRWLCYLVYLGMKPTNSRAADFFGVWDVKLKLKQGVAIEKNGVTFLLESGMVKVSRGSDSFDLQDDEQVLGFGFSFSRRGDQVTWSSANQRTYVPVKREPRRMNSRHLLSLFVGDSDE